jgi:hypothetical protein
MEAWMRRVWERVRAVGIDAVTEGLRLIQTAGEQLLQLLAERRLQVPSFLRDALERLAGRPPEEPVEFVCRPAGPDTSTCRPADEPAAPPAETAPSPAEPAAPAAPVDTAGPPRRKPPAKRAAKPRPSSTSAAPKRAPRRPRAAKKAPPPSSSPPSSPQS